MALYDNQAILQKYNYKKLGIIAEPYFDLDFNDIFYITDTGRRWDGHLFNVRDKATKENPVTNEDFLNLRFHSTFDLIQAIYRRQEQNTTNQQKEEGHCKESIDEATSTNLPPTPNFEASKQIFPNRAMQNFHPQRWNSNPYLWTKELIMQNAKNQVKRFLVKK